MDGLRVIVCGGRDYQDRSAVFTILDFLDSERRIGTVIHGGAPGADQLGSAWASARRRHVNVFPAKWESHGRAAGPIRNAQMLEEAAPDLVVAFPGGRGTADMIRQAHNAGVEVVEANK